MISLVSVIIRDGKVVVYALRQLRIHKRIYVIQDLEIGCKCCDASLMSLNRVLVQDGKVVACVLRQLKIHGRDYPTHFGS